MALNKLDNGGGIVVTPPPGPPGGTPAAIPTAPTAPSAGQDPIAPPAPPPPDSVQTAPAYTPDWQAAIQGDSGYQAAQSAATAAQQSAQAQRQAAIRAAYVQYGGELPPGFKDAYGDIDQATLDAAKGNQFSNIANLKRGYDQSVEQFRRALAARGMVGSGDMALGQQNLDQGFGQQEYDAANQFGNTIQGALRGYSDVLGQNQQNLVGAIGQAEANQYSDPMNRPSAAKTAALNADLTKQYGVAVYQDDQGNYFDQSGNPWSPPAASAASAPYDPYGYRNGNAYRPGIQM